MYAVAAAELLHCGHADPGTHPQLSATTAHPVPKTTQPPSKLHALQASVVVVPQSMQLLPSH